MANYTKVFTKPYADGYEDLPSQNTPITAETLNDKDDTLEHIEDYLYDNPIAEVVDNLTTNDASKALSAKQGKILNDTKLNVNDLPNSEVQTSDDGQFTTVTGGLMQKCIVDLEPIQSGSGTPTPSNVRTISGHTQVQVGNCGKNVFDEVYPNIESYTSATVAYKAIAVSNGTYTMSTNAPKNISENANLFLLEGNVQTGASTANNGVSVGISRTVESVNGYITVGYRMTDGVDPRNYNVQIEKGSQATEYEPYKGYTTIINLGGTYYGGVLDAVSGVLTVTHEIVDLGTLSWTYDTNVNYAPRFFSINLLSLIKKPATGTTQANILCSIFEATTDSELGKKTSSIDNAIAVTPTGWVYIKDTAYTDASAFKTAMSGVMLCYELATPQTIQLTPAQLETLVGKNDVFAPLVGQTIESVEYREVLAIDDVPKAIPYENVAPDMGTGENRTYFRIKKYGRLVQLEFIQSNYWMVVEQQTKVVFGVLPDGYYDKQPSSMLHPDVEFEYPFVNETTTNQYDNRKLFINMVNGEVYSVYQANDVIHPMGSLIYILDHD